MTQTNKLFHVPFLVLKAVGEIMSFASTSIRSFTVLTEDDGVPGSKFEREPEYYTVDQLKRWLKCRGLKQGGKREEILKRVKYCIFSGSHGTLDSSIDDGKWFALKAIKENSELKENNSVVSLPVIPTTDWREFQSHDIPSLFNYGTRWNPFKMSEVSVTRTDSDI